MVAPDTSNLASAADVFAATYTLPQIRAIHKSLHDQAEEKSTRLRNKVGNSYRELLGTADTIVQMKQDTDAVQQILNRMSTNTSSLVLKKKTDGLTRYDQVVVSGDSSIEASEIARAKIWEATNLAFSGILRGSKAFGLENLGRGERLVLATKVLVLSRVLIASFKGSIPMSQYARKTIGVAEKSLQRSRNKIRRGIAKALEEACEEEQRYVVLKALAAYSLLTNSGAQDALKHFLHTRGAAMALSFELEEDKRELTSVNAMNALKLYTSTLLDVQALVPVNLSRELQSLKKTRLLADTSLQSLQILRLDTYEKWCGDDVQFFTPYIRHDDLDGDKAKSMLLSWANDGSKALLDGIEKTLLQIKEFRAITDLRTQVLQHWVREGSRIKGIDSDEMFKKLRSLINTQLQRVLDTKISKIHLVSSEVSSTLDSWVEGETDAVIDMWDTTRFDMKMGRGAVPFITEVIVGMNGHNNAVSRAVSRYQAWYSVINDVRDVVEILRRQRWDNDFEEIEAEETIEARQQLLSKDDPRALAERLTGSLQTEFIILEKDLVQLWTSKETSLNSGEIAAYFLRIIRSIRSALPDIPSVKSFCLEVVPKLQQVVVRDACISPLDEYVLAVLSKRTVSCRRLWEGEPSLPTQPSPGTFKFLRNLSTSMGDKYSDLWSPTAVALLRRHMARLIKENWVKALVDLEEKEDENDEAPKQESQPIDNATEGTLGNSDGNSKSEIKPESESKPELEPKSESMEELEPESKLESKPESKPESQTEPDAGPKDDSVESCDRGEAPDVTTEDTKEKASLKKKEVVIQWLYDVLYLGNPFSSSEDEDLLKSLEDTLFEHSGLELEAKQKLAKSASDYWKRTFILFGLLQ
ncbi:Vps51/Vps67 [Ceratocystis platani]|uniref:Conserved oligomeric Golgi complex subunit 1 n=1 Tax=Ceratocystis fimbriata f. sp. platani TaxID=88771 RepID=A0A0F8CRJ2_CERFI|nr:Vps51/Vps67 [Ceratocystis platani]